MRIQKRLGPTDLYQAHKFLRALNKVQGFSFRMLGFLKKGLARLSKWERVTVIGLLIVIGLSSSALLIVDNRERQVVPLRGGSIIEGVVGKAQIINPLYSQVGSVDQDITRLVFSGLIKISPGREFLPDLARSWDVLDKGKTYIFHLRDDVLWHDNEPFNADDVLFTLGVIQSEGYPGMLREGWNGVDVVALDELTVRFTLPSASTFFLSQATVGILPSHQFAHLPVVEIGNPDNNVKPIGTGPYRISSLATSRDALTLTLNEDYYGTLPYIEKLVFYFYDSNKSLLNAMRGGSVTSAGFVSLGSDQDTDLPNIQSYVYPLPQYRAVFFNQLGGNPALAEVAVRRALSLAANKSKIIRDVALSNASRVDSPILPGFWGHLPNIKRYDFDFVAARDVLHNSGWKDTDSDGVLDKGDLRFSLTLSYRDDVANNQIAQILASDWRAIGAEVILNPVSTADLFDVIIRPRNYDALIFGQNLGSDSDPYVYWHSSQTEDPGLALSVMYDKDIDNNLEMARLSSDILRAINYYHRFQTAFANTVPAILLYQPNYTYLVDEKVKGVTENINFGSLSDRFASINEWYIKQKKTVSTSDSEINADNLSGTDIINGEGINDSESVSEVSATQE